jgi:hypothetical protein
MTPRQFMADIKVFGFSPETDFKIQVSDSVFLIGILIRLRFIPNAETFASGLAPGYSVPLNTGQESPESAVLSLEPTFFLFVNMFHIIHDIGAPLT